MVLMRVKTLAIVFLVAIFTLFSAGTAMADHNSTTTPTTGLNVTPTPTSTPTPTPTPNATATPVPTPAPRQVFSSNKWDADHETIVVTNNGPAITVTAWIDDPSNYLNYTINASETKTVSTPSILAQDGQIVNFGFLAYENRTLIQSQKFTITLSLASTPTPLPPEDITISGTVVDVASNAPVAGAKITFEPQGIDKTYGPVTTDDSGFFTSPKMYTGVKYAIKVTAGGYQAISSITDNKITVDSTVSIPLTKLAGAPTPTPTPTPVPPSPTPGNPFDSWISLLYNPALCVGTISSLIAVIAGSIGIYEWMERKREGRLKKGEAPKGEEKKGEEKKGDDKKDEAGAGIKKP